jgi:hypothetical protein
MQYVSGLGYCGGKELSEMSGTWSQDIESVGFGRVWYRIVLDAKPG